MLSMIHLFPMKRLKLVQQQSNQKAQAQWQLWGVYLKIMNSLFTDIQQKIII